MKLNNARALLATQGCLVRLESICYANAESMVIFFVIQNCADGYHRVGEGPFLGTCVKCSCNGHSDVCDKATGNCLVSVPHAVLVLNELAYCENIHPYSLSHLSCSGMQAFDNRG